MKKIFKYPLAMTDYQNIKMGLEAEILTVGTQFDTVCLWALVDPEEQSVSRTIKIVGTGHLITEADNEMKYIGTFQLSGGSLIFHVFEIL